MLLPLTATALPENNKIKLLHIDHPLVGKIWQVAKQQFVSREDLLADLKRSDYLMLGETHDNIVHHQHQVWVIQQLHQHLAKQKRPAAVMFEMINEQQAAKLDKNSRKSTETILKVLEQEKTGWQYRIFYKPVFDSVLEAGFEIYPANLDRQSLMDIVRKGEKHVPKTIKSSLDNNQFTEQQKKSIQQEIVESHCNMANEGMIAGMTLAQRVKDAVMGNSLVDNAPQSVKILIAGSGHVRNDRGVPMYVKQREKAAQIITVAFMEVMENEATVDYYKEQWGDSELPFDYVWFTPRVEREDPCEEYARHLKKHQSNKPTQN